MNKIGIVIKREYLERVTKKSFIILTLFMPFIIVAIALLPAWLSSIKSSDTYDVAILDHTGKYASLFKDTDTFHFQDVDRSSSVDNYKEQHSGIFAFLEITDDLLNNQNAVTLYSEKQIPLDLKREIDRTLSQYLENEKRASFNIPNLEEIIQSSRVQMDVQTIKWGKDGTTTESSTGLAMAIGMILTMIIFMFIMMSGAMVMQSVMEEKTNRIVELMISSVRPYDLMMGKIISMGLVCLTQLIAWCMLSMVLFSIVGIFLGAQAGQDAMAVQSSMQSGAFDVAAVTGLFTKLASFNFAEIIVCFILYFIGGYMIYSSLYAAIGSAVDSPEDSQQFIAPMMIFMLFAFYAGFYSAQNPYGPLAFWCSFIPFTSPMVMMVRIPFEAPFWQILVSLFILFASALFFVWISAKIYRVGILIYGKKPTFKEMIRWIKY
jgi:ABC-2 type transport system permease protein